jgi:hypothetical protein
MEEILSNNHNIKFILTGDYNLPNVSFSNDSDGIIFNGVHSDKVDVIFDYCQLNDLRQYNNNFNNSGSLFDLIFNNILNTTVTTTNDVLVPIDNYHPALITVLELNS